MVESVPPETSQVQSMRLAGFITGTLMVFNTAFYFLSNLWFEDHPTADIFNIRIAFLILTAIISGASYAAALAPRLIGHGLALLIGVTSIVGGIAAFANDMPGVMGITLLAVGVLLPVLVYYSMNYSRGAWSFLISTLAVFGTVDFFGAPKIRAILGIGIWSALILPSVQIIAVIALAMLRDEYRDHT